MRRALFRNRRGLPPSLLVANLADRVHRVHRLWLRRSRAAAWSASTATVRWHVRVESMRCARQLTTDRVFSLTHSDGLTLVPAKVSRRIGRAVPLLACLLRRLARFRSTTLLDAVAPGAAPGEAAAAGRASEPLARSPLDLAIPISSVQRFLCRAIDSLIPTALVGGARGRRVLLSKLAVLPGMGETEALPAQWLYQGFPTRPVSWAAAVPRTGRIRRQAAPIHGGGEAVESVAKRLKLTDDEDLPAAECHDDNDDEDACTLSPRSLRSHQGLQSGDDDGDDDAHDSRMHWSSSRKRRERRKRKRRVSSHAAASDCPPSFVASRGDTLQTFLVQRVLRWIVDDLALPLLRAAFHVTESESLPRRLLWFRRRDWRAMEAASFGMVAERLRLEPREIRTLPSVLGWGPLRLIPKGRGLRPIVNLSAPMVVGTAPRDGASAAVESPVLGQGLISSTARASVNSCLTSARHLLASIAMSSPIISGAQVDMLNAASIHRALRAFRSVRASAGRLRSPLHAASADVQQCYDRIPHSRLLHVLPTALAQGLSDRECRAVLLRPGGGGVPNGEEARRQLHSAPMCVMRTLAVCRRGLTLARCQPDRDASQPSLDRLTPPTVTFMRHASPLSEAFAPSLSALIAGSSMRGTLLGEVHGPRPVDVEGTLGLIERHVTENTIRFRDRYFTQHRGIPQGSTVSGLLCNLHYGALDTYALAPAILRTSTPRSSVTMLLRLLDDYLILSDDVEATEACMRTLNSDLADWGCTINPEKSLRVDPTSASPARSASASRSSPPRSPSVRRTPAPAEAPEIAWCGLILTLDGRNGMVRIDWTRLEGGALMAGGTRTPVDLWSAPLDAIMAALRQSVRRRAVGMLFDREVCTLSAAMRNVTEAAVVCTIRCLALLTQRARGQAGSVERTSSDTRERQECEDDDDDADHDDDELRQAEPEDEDDTGAMATRQSSSEEDLAFEVLSKAASLIASIVRNRVDGRAEPNQTACRPQVDVVSACASAGGTRLGGTLLLGGDGVVAWLEQVASSQQPMVVVAPLLAGLSDESPAEPVVRMRRDVATSFACRLASEKRLGDGLALPWCEITVAELRLLALVGIEAALGEHLKRTSSLGGCTHRVRSARLRLESRLRASVGARTVDADDSEGMENGAMGVPVTCLVTRLDRVDSARRHAIDLAQRLLAE